MQRILRNVKFNSEKNNYLELQKSYTISYNLSIFDIWYAHAIVDISVPGKLLHVDKLIRRNDDILNIALCLCYVVLK